MVELGNGTKQILLSGNKSAAPSETINFVSDEDVSVSSSKEVYFLWLSRLVVLCAVLSMSLFLSSTLVIFRLAPEILVEPLLLVRQNDSDSMVRYEPIDRKMPSLQQFTEMYIKQYIIMRNTVINDLQEMQTRWGPGGIVQYMSAPEVYDDFVGKNEDSIDKMFDNGYSSEVRIDSIRHDGGENSPAWAVEFTVFSLSKGRQKSGELTLKTQRYKVSITPRFIPERRLIRPRLINPLGFTVLKYNQSEIRE